MNYEYLNKKNNNLTNSDNSSNKNYNYKIGQYQRKFQGLYSLLNDNNNTKNKKNIGNNICYSVGNTNEDSINNFMKLDYNIDDNNNNFNFGEMDNMLS